MSLGKPSPEMQDLVDQMRNRGWSIYQWATESGGPPEILAAVYTWDDGAADVAILRSHLMAGVYRAMPCNDVFDPLAVTLWEMSAPVIAFRTALEWEPYGQERQQREAIRPPAGLGVKLRTRMRLHQRIDLPSNAPPIETPPFVPFS